MYFDISREDEYRNSPVEVVYTKRTRSRFRKRQQFSVAQASAMDFCDIGANFFSQVILQISMLSVHAVRTCPVSKEQIASTCEAGCEEHAAGFGRSAVYLCPFPNAV